MVFGAASPLPRRSGAAAGLRAPSSRGSGRRVAVRGTLAVHLRGTSTPGALTRSEAARATDEDPVAERWSWLPQEETSVGAPEHRRAPAWSPVVMGTAPSAAFVPPHAGNDVDAPAERTEQRQSDRYAVLREILVRHGDREWTGSITNLSLGGARLRLPENNTLAMGDRIQVSFSIPTHAEKLTATALVRWRVDRGMPLFGVQFITGFRARETWALGRFLEQLRREG